MMANSLYGIILLLGLPRPTPSPPVPGHRAKNIEAPSIVPGEYRIIDLDKCNITSLEDLRMDVRAGQQLDPLYFGLSFEHADGKSYNVQNMSPMTCLNYGKPLSGDLRRRCWKVRRTRQFYHLANPVGQMNTVSEAFPRDLSHAALGTTLVCQVDDNTISLGLCKVLGFRKAEYEESDYIFVILKRWNGGSRSIPGQPSQSPTISPRVGRKERFSQGSTVSVSAKRQGRLLQSQTGSFSDGRKERLSPRPTISSSAQNHEVARAGGSSGQGYPSVGQKRKADGDIALESIVRPDSREVDFPLEKFSKTGQADSITKEASYAPWDEGEQIIVERMEDGEIRTYR
ncbi:hypothetical protein FOZ61_003089 [Perkinsus olseni]|uniref:Uncharacterized protein n=1 Tax=Perkinsus olseni TaxID=32597 RepID=A0A7J6LQJ4_PEROL|nr:hypothetical protein FOZ61_003089 [Perkinsus olseni]